MTIDRITGLPPSSLGKISGEQAPMNPVEQTSGNRTPGECQLELNRQRELLAVNDAAEEKISTDKIMALYQDNQFSNGTFNKTAADKYAGISLVRNTDGSYPSFGEYISAPITANFEFNEIIASYNDAIPQGTGIAIYVMASKTDEKSQTTQTSWYLMGARGDIDIDESVNIKKDAFGKVSGETLSLNSKFNTFQYKVVFSSKNKSETPVLKQMNLLHTDTEKSRGIKYEEKIKNFKEELPVTHRSQKSEDPGLSGRICGPTSLAMVMEYHGINAPTAEVAKNSYDKTNDIYGNWAYLVACASEYGLKGAVQYFTSLDGLKEEIKKGHPVIVGVVYEKGDRSGAPFLESTNGHLLVVIGFDKDGNVLVADPAAPDAKSGITVYKKDEFIKAAVYNGTIVALTFSGTTPYQDAKKLAPEELKARVDAFMKLDISAISIQELRPRIGEWLCYKIAEWEANSPNPDITTALFKDRFEKAGLSMPCSTADLYDKVLRVLSDEELKNLATDIQQGKSFLRVLFDEPSKKVQLFPDAIYNRALEFNVDFKDINSIIALLKPHFPPKPPNAYYKEITLIDKTGKIIEITGDMGNIVHIGDIVGECQKIFASDPNTQKVRAIYIAPLSTYALSETSRCTAQDPNHPNNCLVRADIDYTEAKVREAPDKESYPLTLAYPNQTVNILPDPNLPENSEWVKVKVEDGNAGYMLKKCLVPKTKEDAAPARHFAVRKLSAEIKLVGQNGAPTGKTTTVPFTTRLKIVGETQTEYLVELPSGTFDKPEKIQGLIPKTSGEERSADYVPNPTGKDIAKLALERQKQGVSFAYSTYQPDKTNSSHTVYDTFNYYFKIPRDADLPYFVGEVVDLGDPPNFSKLEEGDVLLFANQFSTSIPGHEGICLGDINGDGYVEFIQNTTSTDGMQITSLKDFYAQDNYFIGARRFTGQKTKDFLRALADPDKVICYEDDVTNEEGKKEKSINGTVIYQKQ